MQSNILDLAIALFFIYFLASLIASSLVEQVARRGRWRAAGLAEGLGRFIGLRRGQGQALLDQVRSQTPRADSTNVLEQVYAQPALKVECPPGSLPDSAPEQVLAEALVDTFADAGPDALDERLRAAQTHHSQADFTAFGALLHRLGERSAWNPQVLATLLRGHLVEAGKAMRSAYKDRSRRWLLGIGLGIAVIANLDTLFLVGQLRLDPEATQRLLAAAEEKPTDWQLQTAADLLGSAPIGWTGEHLASLASFWNILLKIGGILLTTAAIGLGAPFWFDLLNKLLAIRSGKSLDSKGDETAADTTTERAAESTPLVNQPRPVGPFQAAAREWHPANALHLARWSERAYLNAGDAGIAELAQSGDYETHLVDLRDHGEQRQHSSDGQVLVAWNDSVVIAAFRGTEGDQLRDLTTDGDIVRFSPHWLNEARGALSAANDSGASSLDLRLHRGFATSENELWNHGLAETLERAGAADKAFWLTGHSLGGALATMTALRLWVEYIAEPRPDRCLPQGLITYGQPAVGDFACAEFLDRRLGRSYWRVINNRDAVPHLPSPALGYHHAGQVALINQRGRLQLEAGLISRIADFLPADFNLQQLVGELVDDHRMPGYLAGLGGRPGTSA